MVLTARPCCPPSGPEQAGTSPISDRLSLKPWSGEARQGHCVTLSKHRPKNGFCTSHNTSQTSHQLGGVATASLPWIQSAQPVNDNEICCHRIAPLSDSTQSGAKPAFLDLPTSTQLKPREVLTPSPEGPQSRGAHLPMPQCLCDSEYLPGGLWLEDVDTLHGVKGSTVL